MKASTLDSLFGVVSGKRGLLVLTHDNPDPDSIAAAMGLKHLLSKVEGLSCTLAFGGMIGRAENRAMVKSLGIDIVPIDTLIVDNYEAIGLVDTQPKFGNNSLPPTREPVIVIDHHTRKGRPPKNAFWDIRDEYGTTSTIIYEYLRSARMGFDMRLATALYYAIKSETQDLGREATLVDKEAYFSLFAMSEPSWLYEIVNASVPREFFRGYARAMQNTTIHGRAICSSLGEVEYPDLVAEVADLVLKMEGVFWALCTGFHDDHIIISIRTVEREANAGRLIQKLFHHAGPAGGHDMMAGGKVSVEGKSPTERRALERRFRQRFLSLLSMPLRGEQLLVEPKNKSSVEPKTQGGQ